MYCLSSFCCVCLSKNTELQDINQLDIDGLPLINKIIFVSFGHEAIDFKVIKKICPECVNILQLAYKFKRSCLMNHELLRMYSGQLKYFTGKVAEYQDLIVSLEKLPEKCDDDEEPEVDNELQEPEPINEENEIAEANTSVEPVKKYIAFKNKKIKLTKLKCAACDLTFNRYVLLQMHYSAKHKSFFKVIKTKINSKSTFSYKCNVCLKKLATLYSLTRHLQLHTNLRTASTPEEPVITATAKSEVTPEQTPTLKPCKFCPTLITSNEMYKKHLISNHANRPTLRCDLCNITLGSDFSFRRHMFMKHTPRKCKHCEVIFFNSSELHNHLVENHRVHQCSYCDKAFCQRRNLFTHMKTHQVSRIPAKTEVMRVYQEVKPIPKLPNIQQREKVVAEEIKETKKEPRISHSPQPALLSLRSGKKCTNCLSVFSSGLSLKRHTCFDLKKLFQCSKCCIIYSKKSSFTNHVRFCVPPASRIESIANTPELQESEQIEMNAETSTSTIGRVATITTIPTTSTLATIMAATSTALPSTAAPEENVIKKENDLEIKEEILDDFICNVQEKEKPFDTEDMYSMNEFTETENNQNVVPQSQYPQLVAKPPEKTPEIHKVDTTKKPPPKKTFPKIKLTERNKRNCEDPIDTIQAIRTRWKNLYVPLDESSNKNVEEAVEEIPSNTSTLAPEVPGSSDSFQNIDLRTIGLFEDVDPGTEIETVFANNDQIIEFSDSNDSTTRLRNNIIDPLIRSNSTSRSTSVSRDSSINANPVEDVGRKEDSVGKRRQSTWVDESNNRGVEKSGAVESSNTGAVVSSTTGVAESSNIAETEFSHIIPLESSNIPLGKSSKNVPAKSSIIPTNFSNIGKESSNIQTVSSNIGTESSNIGTESSNIDLVSSNIRTESSNIDLVSSNIGTESSNIDLVSSNIGTQSSNIETGESSNNLVNPKKDLPRNRRKSVCSITTSNENSNESSSDKTGNKAKKRRRSIWIEDVVEFNDNFSLGTETAESSAPTQAKQDLLKKRRMSTREGTSNENSNDSLTETTDKTEKVGVKTAPAKKRRKNICIEDELNADVINTVESTKEPVRKRRNSTWTENTSNENSNDSLIETTDKTEAGVKKGLDQHKSVCTSNENSNESFIDDDLEPGEVRIEPGAVRIKPVNKRCKSKNVGSTEKEIIQNPIRLDSKSVFVEDPTILLNTQTLNEKNNESTIDNNSASNTENNHEATQEVNKNMEPIILKTRRSMKRSIKSRRKTISALSTKTDAQETQKNDNTSILVLAPSDVNENIANVGLIAGSDSNAPESATSASSTIQTFTLRSLRLKSVCSDGQPSPKMTDDLNVGQNAPKNNDISYITVRKVSDINNDISG